MKRVALYVRVSHEEQVKHGISVDAQVSALKAYSEENNYTIVKIYRDEGISARKTYLKRPALLEMIADCKKGLIDLILICKLDRFFRSVSDYYAVMDQLGNVPWKAIQEDYETETASGVFKVNIMLSVAQSEADRTSERIKAVFEYKKSKGEALTGTAATGYIYKDKKWYKDPATSKGVDAFFETYLVTFNKKLAIAKARELGVHISDETARHMLYSDRYYGVVPYITESYITQEQHDLIVSKKPKCERHNKYEYIFSGLVRCGKCGRAMSAMTSVKTRKSGEKAYDPLYICDYGRRNYNCEGSQISERRLQKIMLDILDEELNKYNIQVVLDNKNDNSEKIKKCNDRLDRIKIMFELGDIDVDEYKAKRNGIIAEVDKFKSQESKKPIYLDSNWMVIYNQLDKLHKNAFWTNLLSYIEVPGKRATSVKLFFK